MIKRADEMIIDGSFKPVFSAGDLWVELD